MLQTILSFVILGLQITSIVLQCMNLHQWREYWSFFEEDEFDDYEQWENREEPK